MHPADGRRAHPELVAALLVALLAVSLLASPPRGFAGEPAGTTPETGPASALELAGDRADQAGATRAPAVRATAGRKLRPMAGEMRAAVGRERAALADLSRRFRAADTPDAALAVQREIERVKHETEVTLLRIQADHARRAGLSEATARIEAVIEEMTRPVPDRTAERAPRRAGNGR